MAYRIPNKIPIDVNARVAVGVSLPFNAPGVFNSTYTTRDQTKSNIINYVLTNPGERVFNPNFGFGLLRVIFDNINPINLQNLEEDLAQSIAAIFPNVTVNNIILTPIYEQNAINIQITYSILNNPLETINITV
jgi:phage baseplate assembly protein W